MVNQNKQSFKPLEPELRSLPWIKVAAKDVPYFSDEEGEPWTPIGQNDAVNWPDLNKLFMRKDVDQVENHLIWLKSKGVNVLRLMLEYSQDNFRFFEKPVGVFNPRMIRYWDDLFYLCEKHELKLFLTPMDTFWMWLRWKHHPYNKKNGGPLAKRSEWFISQGAIEAVKNRFSFAIDRWGGSGAIFAWDLWNEIHPALSGGKTEFIPIFISEISEHIRKRETELYGKTHLQTVSVFGPLLKTNPELSKIIFQHPSLDFATSHFYDSGTINNPKNTVQSAIVVGDFVREALDEIDDHRPFLDSEHGPIHMFKNRKRTLPESFDDEYFKHIQWAHLASGGAGGGMRWPNRHPHVLTHGMRNHQLILSKFCRLINWNVFRRKNLNNEVKISTNAFVPFCCGDQDQAIIYLLRKDRFKKKQIDKNAPSLPVEIAIPGLSQGNFSITKFNTETGSSESTEFVLKKSLLQFSLKNISTDIAVVIKNNSLLQP